MSEEEAKTKWCPFARFDGSSGGSFNRGEYDPMNHPDAGNDFVPRCIGSACMAWRWDLDGFDLEFDAAGPLRVRKTKLAHGHCGMAGKP